MQFEISIGYDNRLLVYKIVGIDPENFWAILQNRNDITDYNIPIMVSLVKGRETWQSNSLIEEIHRELVLAIEYYLKSS